MKTKNKINKRRILLKAWDLKKSLPEEILFSKILEHCWKVEKFIVRKEKRCTK